MTYECVFCVSFYAELWKVDIIIHHVSNFVYAAVSSPDYNSPTETPGNKA